MNLVPVSRSLLVLFVCTMGIAVPALPLDNRIQISDIVMALCLLFSANEVASRYQILRGLAWPGLALAFAGLTLLSAISNGTGLAYAVGTAELVAVLCVAAIWCSEPGFAASLLRAWTISAAVLGALGFLGVALDVFGIETVLGPYRPNWWAYRIKGLCASPNLLASLCIVPMLALFSPAGKELFPGRARYLLLSFLVLTMLFTTSRSLLALAAGLVLIGSWPGPKGRAAAILILAVLAGFSVGFQWIYSDGVLAPGGASSTRLEILKQALAHAQESPLLGIGPGARVATVPFPDSSAPFPTQWSAHQTWVSIAATTGVPAVLVFALLLLVVWRPKCTGGSSLEVLAWASIGAMVFDSFTVDSERFRHLWLLLGIRAGLMQWSRQSARTASAVPTSSS